MSKRPRIEDDDPDSPFDKNGLLKDQHTARVPLMLRDSAPQWQDSADRYFDRKGVKVRDGANGVQGLHRPGFRLDATVSTDEREAAYRAYDTAIGAAYKQHDASGVQRGGQVGDVCMVSGPEYPLDHGSPGHLQMRGGQLVCVPDAPRAKASSRDHGLTMDAAYQNYDRDLANAWRSR
jgi:hypothetical protein